MWNEEPYSANLIPVIFVFTFVYLIILYAFSKVIEGNVLVLNCMTKTFCFRSDRGVIEDFFAEDHADKLLHVRLRLLYQLPQQRYSPCHIDGDGTGEPHNRILPP